MMRLGLAGLVLSILPVSAHAQPSQAQMWEDIGKKFGTLITRKGYNCPEGKFAAPKGQDAYGQVYWVVCGEKGKDPFKEGAIMQFRLTFKPNKDFIVQPWVE